VVQNIFQAEVLARVILVLQFQGVQVAVVQVDILVQELQEQLTLAVAVAVVDQVHLEVLLVEQVDQA
jgi:hypothetical protein